MSLTAGTKLGPYEIQSLLGAGGMGEVYRARDTRLGREVALKILPESFAQDEERLHRFEQESRAVATLNHPNILAIYDVGTHNQTPFLVSELLEGESLREVLQRGALPQRKVIDYGVQIAQGLAAAHEKGIVHRDLKPENLFITREGRAKILDFGLAKFAHAQAEAVAGFGATMTSAATAAGMVMGTASYMAPEQVRGETVDARTDIFALGAVLFEMLAGRQVFHRDTAAETMTAVLKEDPPEMPDLSAQIAPALDRIVRRCLEKSPQQRFQSAKDLSFALGVLSGTEMSGAARAAKAVPVRKPWTWAALALLVMAAGAAGWWFAQSPAEASRMEFAIPVPGEVSHLAISADGKLLAYVSPDDRTGTPMLFVQHVGAPDATELAGTEGANYPFWSPDDTYVAFFANSKLQKIAINGGPPQTITKVSYGRGGSWNKKNVILYSPETAGPLWRVNADGSDARPLTDKIMKATEDSHRWPLFLPDGDHFLFLVANFTRVAPADDGVYLSSLSKGERKQILPGQTNIGFANGDLFYIDEKKTLNAVPLDIGKGSVSGNARVVAGGVGYQPSVYWGAFAVAENDTVVYSASAMAARSVLTWFSRGGKEMQRIGEPALQANPSLSPDGTQAALDITDLKSANLDVWIEHLQNGTSTRFTFDPAEETTPVWSRDGALVAYRTVAGGSAVVLKAANGMHGEKRLFTVRRGLRLPGGYEASDLIPNSWSSDDKQILCSMQVVAGGSRSSLLAVIPASGGEPVPFLPPQSSDNTNGQISPDGKWVLYASNESGDWEIYATTFPGAQGKWQVSRGGGSEPRWKSDGKEMYYLNSHGLMMAVAVDAGATFSSGTPAPLFQVRGRAPISSTDLFTYDVAKDGQRFLVNQYVKPEHVEALTIVQHALAPAPK